jgi:hypothetical protein
MLVRTIADQGVAANTHAVAVTVTGILDQPLRAFAYFDTVHGWLKQPLSLRQQTRLRRDCPDLWCDTCVAWFDYRYRQRLQLPQPSTATLKTLTEYSGDTALLNYGEFALDLLPPDRSTLNDLVAALFNSFAQRWHLGKQIKWYPAGFTTRPFEPDRPKRGYWFHGYWDEPCRIDGHKHCVHMQGRVQGAALLRRFGIHRPSDLLSFDLPNYWQDQLRLYRVDYERLGRFDSNRRHHSRRTKPELKQWGKVTNNRDAQRGYALYQVLSYDDTAPVLDSESKPHSMQRFVDSYDGGHYRPYLIRLPITLTERI